MERNKERGRGRGAEREEWHRVYGLEFRVQGLGFRGTLQQLLFLHGINSPTSKVGAAGVKNQEEASLQE
jgi:hypothetical protein